MSQPSHRRARPRRARCPFALAALLCALPVACHTPGREVGLAEQRQNNLVRVYFGTDRDRTGARGPNGFYGNEPADIDDGGRVEYGVCEVSLPPDRQIGEYPRPGMWDWVTLSFGEDEEEHVVLKHLVPREKGDFFAELSRVVESSSEKEAFVFVHGYNVRFDDAVRRTAQIAHDIGLDMAPILWSWSAGDWVLDYKLAENNIPLTIAFLREFLADIRGRTGVRRMHLIAHSMGNRTLKEAVEELERGPLPDEPIFENIVMAAPDVDEATFKTTFAPVLRECARRVTLYTSEKDVAIDFSEWLNGRERIRARTALYHHGVDPIETSPVTRSLVGHSFLMDSREVLSDLSSLLRDGADPGGRGLEILVDTEGQLWTIRP